MTAQDLEMLSVLIAGHTDERATGTRFIRYRSFLDALCDCCKSIDRERFLAACDPTTDRSYQ